VRDLLGNNKGAAIMMDPRNGELLALASAPAFDPNKFISGISDPGLENVDCTGITVRPGNIGVISSSEYLQGHYRNSRT